MGDNQAGSDTNVFLLAGFTIIFGVLLHFIYKIAFARKKEEALQDEAESEAAPERKNSETTVSDTRSGGKRKKQTWKTKTDFSHPWLLKNLKGHPGNVMLVDFSANGKFMAATCDGKCLRRFVV
ncbi:hypothetical protein O0L34_g5972 [Tuta absoluta]|nr:hypothetical protein O0L34_g5972 [Tuta absoluta]